MYAALAPLPRRLAPHPFSAVRRRGGRSFGTGGRQPIGRRGIACRLRIPIRRRWLAEALPYIQDYAGKVVVVKYGGNAMVDGALKAAVMSDIVLLSLVGIKIVLVHGGGPEITETLKAIGKESRFIGGLRYTDEETLKVAQMVLAGKTNKDLVNLLEQQGGRAIGLCGIDGR